MDDLISRKAVIDKAITIPIAKIVTEDKVIYRRIVFVEDIENLPSAQPEIIRCEHCYHALEEGPKLWCTKGPISIRVNPTHFCGFAERRKK